MKAIVLSHRRLLLLMALTVVILLFWILFASAGRTLKTGATNRARVDYAASLGYQIDTATAVIQTTVPDHITDPDFFAYRGCRVTAYRYPLTDREDADLDLFVYHGRVIATRLTDYHGEVYGKDQTGSVSVQSDRMHPQ